MFEQPARVSQVQQLEQGRLYANQDVYGLTISSVPIVDPQLVMSYQRALLGDLQQDPTLLHPARRQNAHKQGLSRYPPSNSENSKMSFAPDFTDVINNHGQVANQPYIM